MRPRSLVFAAVLALGSFFALADSPQRCLDLRAQRDTEEIVGGIRVTVSVRNSCGEDFPGGRTHFRVTVRSKNGGTAGTQTGRFGGTIPASGGLETKVFVACEPDRAGQIEVELLD